MIVLPLFNSLSLPLVLWILMVDVILSLVRTKVFGYLRDIRRWVVAMSRAKLGLYVLGRQSLFQSCPEIQETWTKLIANGDKLELVSGEMWPTQRKVCDTLYEISDEQVDEVVESNTIEGVEHMGQYVFAMIENALKEQGISAKS